MPNWAEGNLRIRGTKENIMNFLKEELIWCVHAKDFEVKEFPVGVEMDDNGYIEIIDKPNINEQIGEPWLYVKDTRRNFVEINNDLWVNPGAEISTVLIDDFRAAWAFHSEPYLEKARKHHVDIKIIAYERGMEFKQVIEIVDGEIVQDEDIQYQDWNWEAEFPHMGG